MAIKLRGMSLFANVGIAEARLPENVEIVLANELLEKRALFYEHNNNGEMVQGDITLDTTKSKLIEKYNSQDCNFIMATPPCQGMSIAGKMAEDDPRNSLIKEVISLIDELKPKYFLIENVQKMPETYIIVDGNKIKIRDYIMNSLDVIYNISINTLNASDYGTPQNRKRNFVLGSIKTMGEWKPPEKFKDKITVRDAIGHLPSLESQQHSSIPFHYAKKHADRHILWMKNTPTGKTAFENTVHYPQKENGIRIKGFSTTYKRMDWDKPAPTITMCNGGISSQNNVHPGVLGPDGLYTDARVLSLKEIFILMGLPDDWTPPAWASENMIREVIGEGVPPLLIAVLLNNI